MASFLRDIESLRTENIDFKALEDAVKNADLEFIVEDLISLSDDIGNGVDKIYETIQALGKFLSDKPVAIKKLQLQELYREISPLLTNLLTSFLGELFSSAIFRGTPNNTWLRHRSSPTSKVWLNVTPKDQGYTDSEKNLCIW